MENNLAALVLILSDIIKSFEAMCSRWHTDKGRHEHFSIAKHLDEENEVYARLRAFLDDLTKEAEKQSAITVAEMEAEARAMEAKAPGR